MIKTAANASKSGPNWVPMIEGARMVVRLGGHEAPWPLKVRAEAGAKLVEALRLGRRIASRGHSEVLGRLLRLSAKDWQFMRPDIDNNRLLPMTPSGRRYPRDGFFNVEVNSTDIQRYFAPSTTIVKGAKASLSDHIKSIHETLSDGPISKEIVRDHVRRKVEYSKKLFEDAWRQAPEHLKLRQGGQGQLSNLPKPSR